MKNRETTHCHACNDAVNPEDLTEIAGDAICPSCVQACEDHYSMDDDDHGDSAYGDDSWIDSRTSITFAGSYDYDADDYPYDDCQYDDDPSPYGGTYSEM